jgi:hypothetical protein
MRTGVSKVVGSLSVLVIAGAMWVGVRPASPPAPSELLYLQTRHGITALDTRSGSTAFTAPGATAAGNWSRLFVAGPAGAGSTLVRRLDPATGQTAESVQVVGHYAVRSVTRTGDAAVLVPTEPGEDNEPPGPTAKPYHPGGRATTELVVVRFDGSAPVHLDLTGNIEPEAFSADGSTIFALDYRPALSPDRYRVRRVDVGSGVVSDVPSNDKEVRGDMQGVARTQALSPDGRRLYTLYTVPGAQPRAFVHVLSLDAQTANCVDLPVPFGRDTGSMALTPSVDGTRLYVADAAHGVLADIDTTFLTVDRVAKIPVAKSSAGRPGSDGPVSITATPGAVFVARGSRITPVSRLTLHAGHALRVRGAVTGVQADPSSGNELYVATRNRVLEVDPGDGRTLRSLRTPDTLGIRHLGYTLPDTGITNYQCAC